MCVEGGPLVVPLVLSLSGAQHYSIRNAGPRRLPVVDQHSTLAVGTLVTNRYRITRTIGAGGMATVYQAVDAATDRVVAIKLLNQSLAGSIGNERFLREIALTSRLRHPSIVPILDSGTHDESPFFVMPFIAGESVCDRLRREKQLSIGDAIRIARDVLSALQVAHGENIVHRDIKPANILLNEERAIVADFGIARAYSEAGAGRVTESGIAIGTQGYMSPEQASGETHLDGRADIYAVGCVLYEMLAGEPPYSGPTPQSIVAKQMSLPVPSLAVVRSTVPASLDALLLRALAKAPADRIATAAEFSRELEAIERCGNAPAGISGAKQERREWAVGVGALGFVLAGVFLTREPSFGSSTTLLPADTTHYTIVTERAGVAPNVLPDFPDLLREALGRWSGITPSDSAAPGVARNVRATLSPAGDSVRLRLTLYEANGALLTDFSERLSRNDSATTARIARAVDRMLFRGSPAPNDPVQRVGRSLPSRQAFAEGLAAANDWRLSRAESLFQASVALDPGYARAHLWLALVRSWQDQATSRWRAAAQQALVGSAELTEREALLARIVAAQSTNDLPRACAGWNDLTRSDSTDAFAWYGSAQCQRNDGIVVRGRQSPSGFRFRTSYQSALRAYRKAFDMNPAILAAFSHQEIRELFHVAGTRIREGWSPAPDSEHFSAHAEWQGDTLAYVPYPVYSARGADPSRVASAVRRLRMQLRDLLSSWVTHSPNDPAAWEALALSLADLGDISAVDTIALSQRLARTAKERLRVQVSAAWLRLGAALTLGQPDRVRPVAALVDSLLRSNPPPAGDGNLLAPLAALTGRADLAARYARLPAMDHTFNAPASLRESAPPLLVYAALGGPSDSIAVLERRAEQAIDATVPPGERLYLRLAFLGRAATMAYPRQRMDALSSLVGHGDGLLDLQAAFDRGETAFVRDSLNRIRNVRMRLSPDIISLDAMLPEAQLLVSLGDFAGAAAWMDPTLAIFGQVIPRMRSEPLEAAAVVRLLALRARIAERLGHTDDASRASRFVRLLWSAADPHLQSVLDSLPTSP